MAGVVVKRTLAALSGDYHTYSQPKNANVPKNGRFALFSDELVEKGRKLQGQRRAHVQSHAKSAPDAPNLLKQCATRTKLTDFPGSAQFRIQLLLYR